MRNGLKLLTAAALVAFASGSLAQETTTEEPAATTPAPAAEEPAASGTETPATEAPATEAPAAETTPEEAPAAETAEPASQEPAAAADPATAAPADAPAEDIVTTVYGDWELRCTSDSTNCFIYQLARDDQENPVAEISIVALPEGGKANAGATVVTPLGTLLTEGVVLQIDSGTARQYQFSWCTRSGCFSRFGLTAEDVNVMKRGNVARMRLASVSAPDAPVTLEVSLSGFTAAFDALTK